MIKKISLFLAFTLIFIFECKPSLSSEKLMLFGKTREQYKNASVFTPLKKEPPAYFDFRMILDEVGIKHKLETNGNIDNLISYLSGKGENKYSILYILTHSSESSFSIELYDTESERDRRFVSLNNDPRFTDKNYFKKGGAEGKYGISITYSFIYNFYKQKDSLVILMGCQASLWGPNAFNPAGAVATVGQPQPIYGSTRVNLNDNMIEEDLPELMKSLSGRRGEEDINNSIGDINRSSEEILKYTSIFLSDMDKGNYVLYQQPRIDNIKVMARKKGSMGTFNKTIYNYSYSGKDTFNPQDEYPGLKSLDNARQGYCNIDDELNVAIEFSKNIFLNKEKELVGGDDEPENSFKLCIYNNQTKKIDFEKCIDIEENSLISYAYDIDDNKLPTGNLSNYSNKISMRFNTKDFEDKDISLDGVTSLCLAIKTADSYLLDGMHYLDTDGDGREDGAISESVDSYNNSNQTYIPYSMDGLDTNHWFQVAIDKIYSLWITPGRSLQGDYNSALASSERTIEGYGYFNYLNKEHLAGKNLNINLLMDVGGLEESGDKNKSAEEKEKDVLKKVEEIGRGVLLKYDGSPMQALVTGVKRSDEGDNKFIISYAFQNPGSDGRHLLEAMFDKDDEKNKPVSFSIGSYASHSLTVDTMSPSLSFSEEKRTCFNISGWLVSGKVSDPGTNPSGIGILAAWTDQAGYSGFPATGSLDKYKNTPLHYDISVKEFQLV